MSVLALFIINVASAALTRPIGLSLALWIPNANCRPFGQVCSFNCCFNSAKTQNTSKSCVLRLLYFSNSLFVDGKSDQFNV